MAKEPELVPTIAYWQGIPLGEMSRDELEREFCAAWQKIEELQRKACERSIAHIRDLAALTRAGAKQ